MPEPKSSEESMARMTAYLGGRSVLKRTLASRLDLVPMLPTGLPFGVLAAVGARLALSVDAVPRSRRAKRAALSASDLIGAVIGYCLASASQSTRTESFAGAGSLAVPAI